MAIVVVCTTWTSALAQTRFVLPDSRIDLSKYTFSESCLAVSERIQDSVNAVSTVRTDTLSFSQYNRMTPLAPAVVDATQRCFAHFDSEKIPLLTAGAAVKAYLIANQDVDAEKVIQRSLNAIPKTDSTKRGKALREFADLYLHAQPMRIAPAVQLFNELFPIWSSISLTERTAIVWSLVEAGNEIQDDAMVAKYTQIIFDELQSARANKIDDPKGIGYATLWTRGMLRMAHRKELLDSLATSAASYARYLTTLDELAMDRKMDWRQRAEAGPAPQINAKFWFPDAMKNTPYPRHGKISLIVSVVAEDGLLNNRAMSKNVAMKRLKARFPDLDLVLVANTVGYFGGVEPPTIEREARLMDSLYHGFLTLPGPLAVIEVPFWRLPNPDKRRINENKEAWGGGKTFYGSTTLVDSNGGLVYTSGLSGPFGERYLEQLIEAVYRREQRTANRTQ